MNSIYVVPITNLILDYPFKYGEFYIQPSWESRTEYYEHGLIYMNTIEEAFWLIDKLSK